MLFADAPPVGAQAAPAEFTFTGSGFGHGVGLSQYGAKRQAEAGRSNGDILGHYYAGSRVETVDDAVPLRVNLVNGAASVEVRGEAATAGGGALKVTAGSSVVGTATQQALSLRVEGTEVVVVRAGAIVGRGASAIVEWDNAATLVDVAGPGETLASRGHRYRHGVVDVSVVGSGLAVVLQLPLHELYLRGIAEMPGDWPAAALQAQAIAARTYALRKFRSGPRPECACHVFDTTADQVYAGWEKESGAGSSGWNAAVSVTSPSARAGQVLTRSGRLAATNYSSSSSGITEANTDGFNSPNLFPELRPVGDVWSATTDNPFSGWVHVRSQAAVAQAFGLPDVVSLDLSRRTAGGAVKEALAVSGGGQRSALRGTDLRFRLSLPSASIGPPVRRAAGADRYATAVAIGRLASPSGRTVVVASGSEVSLIDGLVAAPLAVSLDAPVLLAGSDGLPGPTSAEVRRRGATTAYLVGGTRALGAGVEAGLRTAGVTTIRRLAGADRFATAAEVARAMAASGSRTHVVVASGEGSHLADALGAGGPAGNAGRPILLSTRDLFPAPSRQALADVGARNTVVVGGAASVSDAVAASLPSPSRVAGADRFATAAAVAGHFFPTSAPPSLVLAAGAGGGLVDALASGALGAPTVLTEAGRLPPSSAAFIASRSRTGSMTVAGGPAAVSDSVFLAARAGIWPSGRLPSRIEGFHEVGFVVQPQADEPGAQPAFKGCAAWADTPERRAQGLRGRNDLAGYDAMAFTVDPPSSDAFVNEGVAMPVEVSWFGADYRFNGSAEMAPCPAGAMCPAYPPPAPWRVALETEAGGRSRLKAGPGAEVLVGGSCPL